MASLFSWTSTVPKESVGGLGTQEGEESDAGSSDGDSEHDVDNETTVSGRVAQGFQVPYISWGAARAEKNKNKGRGSEGRVEVLSDDISDGVEGVLGAEGEKEEKGKLLEEKREKKEKRLYMQKMEKILGVKYANK